MTTSKTTNKTALLYALNNLPDAPADVREKWEKMIAQLDKKSSAERKPTAKQTENAGIRAELVEFITDGKAEGYTVSDLLKECPAVEGMSNQKVSAILRQAVIANEVSKTTVKRRTYFVAYDPALSGEVEAED